MKLVNSIMCLGTISLMLTGCVGPKQTMGGLGGAAVGGLAGAQIGRGKGRLVATALGTLLGGAIGSSIGQQMDTEDQEAAGNAMQTALDKSPDNQTQTWQNPNNNHRGQIQPIRTYQRNGQPCREFCHTVWIGGRQEQVYGKACRDAAGDWRIVE